MQVGPAIALLLALGLIGCGGGTGSTSIVGDNPAALRTAPAGIATLVFMDLEALRPDLLASSGTLADVARSAPVNGVTTYTFNNYTAANAGTATGTVKVAHAGATYTETFDLTVTSVLLATPTTPATVQTWKYRGIQVVTVAGSSATVRVAPAFTAVFNDGATPANNKTYAFTASLGEDWSDPARALLTGGYTFSRALETITGTIAGTDPLVWSSACDFPASGTVALNLMNGTTGADATNVGFDSGVCGQVSIGGTAIALGGH
jgi:hypothetical protein